MAKTIFGVFSDRAQAEEALTELEDEGYNVKDMSIIMKDRGEAQKIYEDTGANIGEGVAKGATTGAVVGGLAGLLIGIGAIAIPGIGGLLVAGPLAAALGLTGAAATTVSGAATGLVAGGLLGALVEAGVPEEQARTYEESVKQGGILLAVPARESEEDEVRTIFSQHNASNVDAVNVSASSEDRSHAHHQHFHGGDMKKHHVQHGNGDHHRHANPIQVQKYLKHVDYPATKDDLIHTAEEEGADDTVLHTLEDLPDEEFDSPKVVAKAIGNIE